MNIHALYPPTFRTMLFALILCTAAGCSLTDEVESGDTVNITVQPPEVESIGTRAMASNAFHVTSGFMVKMGICLMNEGQVTAAGATAPGYHNICALFKGNGSALLPDGYELSDGKSIEDISVRKSSVLDVYGYYPYDTLVTDLRAIPFTTRQTPGTLVGIDERTDFPVDYMYIAPEHAPKSTPASQVKTLTPRLSHVMTCYRMTLYNTSYPASSTNTISGTTLAYKSESEPDPETASHLWGIPADGNFSAVDGTVHVTGRADTLRYDYTPRSFGSWTYLYFPIPEMILGDDGYPNDAKLQVTIWLNSDDPFTPRGKATHTISLANLTSSGSTKKGLVKGYMYSQTVYIANHRQITVSPMTITPWGDPIECPEIDM